MQEPRPKAGLWAEPDLGRQSPGKGSGPGCAASVPSVSPTAPRCPVGRPGQQTHGPLSLLPSGRVWEAKVALTIENMDFPRRLPWRLLPLNNAYLSQG